MIVCMIVELNIYAKKENINIPQRATSKNVLQLDKFFFEIVTYDVSEAKTRAVKPIAKRISEPAFCA